MRLPSAGGAGGRARSYRCAVPGALFFFTCNESCHKLRGSFGGGGGGWHEAMVLVCLRAAGKRVGVGKG